MSPKIKRPYIVICSVISFRLAPSYVISFGGMPVAGQGNVSAKFLFHRRRKTANLNDNEIHVTAETIFISKHFAILRFWQGL